jgi:hypothetical protein
MAANVIVHSMESAIDLQIEPPRCSRTAISRRRCLLSAEALPHS